MAAADCHALSMNSSSTLLPAATPAAWVCRVLMVLLGATGLAGQVCWSRIASAAVGGATASSILTLSSAMAGLSAGALLAGFFLQRMRARTLLLAVIPLCAVALWGVPWLLLRVNFFEGSLPLRRCCGAALLALAHAPFGALLPAASGWRGMRNSLGLAAGDLVAAGAFGAALGGVLVGEVLAQRLGLDHIGMGLSLVTLATLGLLFLPSRQIPAAVEPSARASQALGTGTLLSIAFGLGFLGLASETLWMRTLGFYWQATTRSYALVTGGYLAGLALGSLTARCLISRWRIGAGGLTVACGLAAATLLLMACRAQLAADAALPWQRVLLVAFLVGLPASFFGAAFVFLLECAGSGARAGRTREGAPLGLLCGVNTAGSAAGPLLLWSALPDLWPAQVLVLLAMGYAALAAAPWLTSLPRVGLGLAGIVGLGLLGYRLAPHQPPPQTYLPQDQPPAPPDFGAVVVPFLSHGRDSTVAVTRETDTGVEVLWIDHTIQGDTSLLGRRVQERQGRLPCALLGRPAQRALVIGLGTGITTSAMVLQVEHADVAELSAGVIEANRTVLAEANGQVAARPNVRVWHADGRSVLCDAAEPYDLIVTDIVYPSVPGAGNLFSREFYALVRRRLAVDGLFVHWLPCFQLSPADLSAITAGFLESFPDGSAWIGYLDPYRLILGLASPTPWPHESAVQSHYALGPRELSALAGGTPPLRDADPRLEYRSPPRQDAAYGKSNLERVLALMRAVQAPAVSAATKQGRAWADARQAWLLFAEAGLAALKAEAGPGPLNHGQGPHEGKEALYKRAAATSAWVSDAAFVLQDLACAGFLSAAANAGARGDVEQMRQALRQAAADPLRGEGNLQLASALLRMDEADQAAVELRNAIAKCPRSADAFMKLALLAYNTRDYDQAKKAFAQAAALRPDRPKVYQVLEAQLGRMEPEE